LLVNAGVRLDRYSRYGARVTPRVGLVLLPRRQTAVKLLYGQAFRAPNPYEREYYNGRMDLAPALSPEAVRSSELVWEELFSKHFRTTVTVFDSDVRDLIEQRPSDSDTVEFYHENAGHTRGRGIETEAEMRLTSGVSARVSHSFVRVSDRVEQRLVSNAPRHLTKLSLDLPVSSVIVALDGQYVSERLTLGGEPLAGFFVPNVTVTAPLAGRWGVGFSLYNVFNQQFADPGAEQHVQPSIRQDGRTMLLRVQFKS
jgi:iron complex outermembrane receptor protein